MRASSQSARLPMKLTAIACTAAMLAYCAYLTMIYLRQDALVFPGHRPAAESLEAMHRYYPGLEDLVVTTADGDHLRGFFMGRRQGDAEAPAVLYFTGNAEDQTNFFLWAPAQLRQYTLAGLDYRGYGASDGTPSEKAVKADALLAYDALSDKIGHKTPIIVMGRSLGSGVALHVAANRPVAGLILVTPYDSLAAVGQQAHPFVPVRLLMRHPFNALVEAPQVTAPSLFLVAGADTLIPPGHAERLAAAWKVDKDYRTLAGATHATILDKPQYWPTIKDFLDKLTQQ